MTGAALTSRNEDRPDSPSTLSPMGTAQTGDDGGSWQW